MKTTYNNIKKREIRKGITLRLSGSVSQVGLNLEDCPGAVGQVTLRRKDCPGVGRISLKLAKTVRMARVVREPHHDMVREPYNDLHYIQMRTSYHTINDITLI